MEANIAVCITTMNRNEIFYDSLVEHGKYRPDNSSLFVVDDASNKPIRIGGYYHRFDENVGVVKAKNKCLELAYNRGAEHIFLFDSDTFPIADNWWLPYTTSGEKHLMFQFSLPGKPSGDMQLLASDGKLNSFSHTRGAMLYIHRSVLDVVGGFDEEYTFDYYHPDFTNRVYNAGLTKYRAADVVGSDKLLYCLDQDGKIEGSIPLRERQKSLRKNAILYRKNKDSKLFKEFRG